MQGARGPGPRATLPDVLNGRIYRAAFVPFLFALVVAGFSLRDLPRPLASPLPPDAFDATAAMRELARLEAAFPRRAAGSAADDRLGREVSGRLRQAGFAVSSRVFAGQTAAGRRRLVNVVGQRTGFSGRRIVVVAHRDALAPPSRASLSSTAALLELARVLGGRTLGRTIVLVSTTAGAAGAAGAAELGADPGGPVDAALVLGGPAGTDLRRPLVVPWSDGGPGAAPLGLERTVQAAIRLETGLSGGASGLAERFARLAVPLSVGEQGALVADGMPAVLVGPSGERGPGASDAVSAMQMQRFGRSVLRSVTALDAGRGVQRTPRSDLVVRSKLLPAWAIRLLVAALAFPALVAAVDGVARVRRRHGQVAMWLGWVLAGALPFLLTWGFLRLARLTGFVAAAPPHTAPAGSVPIVWAALGCAALVLALGWLAVRPVVLRALRVRGDVTSAGAAAALMLVLGGLTVVVWVRNPFAAALLLPLLHLGLAVAAPEVRLSRPVALGLALLALAPLALVAAYYASAFAMGPAEVAWTGALLLAGGQVGVAGGLALCVLGGCAASVVAVALRSGRPRAEQDVGVTVRGPVTYAGPGSLGGTESALRR